MKKRRKCPQSRKLGLKIHRSRIKRGGNLWNEIYHSRRNVWNLLEGELWKIKGLLTENETSQFAFALWSSKLMVEFQKGSYVSNDGLLAGILPKTRSITLMTCYVLPRCCHDRNFCRNHRFQPISQKLYQVDSWQQRIQLFTSSFLKKMGILLVKGQNIYFMEFGG